MSTDEARAFKRDNPMDKTPELLPTETRSRAELIAAWMGRPGENDPRPTLGQFESLTLLRCDLFSRLSCPESIKGGKAKR